jgi:aminopeptidase-like protein
MIKSSELPRILDRPATGSRLFEWIERLYPICRSITGDGFRKSLGIIRDKIPIEIHEVPSGTRVFDWTIPREWNIRDAYLRAPDGSKVIDFRNSNLHVMSYSVPVKKTLTLEELKPHLFTNPDHQDWIPYRTSYYKDNWGFCLPHRLYSQLTEGNYEAVIDSTLENGSLTYGEFYIQGKSSDEMLISAHCCHPSLCNDNLSGVAIAIELASLLSKCATQLSYRFLFIPGAIGSITWLALNEDKVHRIKNGLVLACVGDAGNSTYKKSRRGDAEIDIAAQHVLKHSGTAYRIEEFSPYGYDERQYCSPGFNLPVGCLMRTPYAQYPEYHTSADNLQLVHPESLADSLQKCVSVLYVLEHNGIFENLNPKCEPQLGKRGLYRSIGGQSEENVNEIAMLWVLNQSDGTKSLLEIAERSGFDFYSIWRAAALLLDHELLKEVPMRGFV